MSPTPSNVYLQPPYDKMTLEQLWEIAHRMELRHLGLLADAADVGRARADLLKAIEQRLKA